MKQLLFVLTAIIGSLGVSAQKDFEGKIVYQLDADKDEKKPELTVWFAPNKLKIVFKENEEPDPKYLLVLMDSGKIFTINTNSQSYKPRKLMVKDNTVFASEKKDIAGQPTTSVKKQGSSSGVGSLGFLATQGMVLNLADNLTYTVPEQYTDNPEFMMVHNGRIALGAFMKVGNIFGGMEEEESEKAMTKITATAISVTPMALGAEEFAIPTGYTLRPKYNNEYGDTTATMVDSAIAALPENIPVKKPAKKPVKKPTGKKTATKPSANRKQ
jgi:hypothetical protein